MTCKICNKKCKHFKNRLLGIYFCNKCNRQVLFEKDCIVNIMDRKLPSKYFGIDREEIKKYRKKIDKIIEKTKFKKIKNTKHIIKKIQNI